MTTRTSMIETLRSRRPNVGLTGEFDGDPCLFEAELETIHEGECQVVARSATMTAGPARSAASEVSRVA